MSNQSLKTQWDLAPLFANDHDPKLDKEKDLARQQVEKFAATWAQRNDYLSDPHVLKQALDEYETWARNIGTSGNVGYYWHLRASLDQADPKLKAQENLIDDFSTELYNQIQFFELRLAKITPSQQKIFLADPSLTDYHHFLERLFAQSAYVLPEDQEKILNLMAQPAYANWVRMTSTFISQEERQVLTEDGATAVRPFAEIASLISSKDKQVRDMAADAFNDIMARHVATATEELNTVVNYKKVQDQLRQMPRPDLARHLSDDIDSDTVDAVVAAVTNKFDIPARFYRLKAQLMGVKKLAYHERNVEYGELSATYTYEQAFNLVGKTFKQLDPEFASILDRFGHQGQIDVYPQKGKHNGAFCIGDSLRNPTYVLLNFTNKLNDVLTLAHEMGHGINNELMRQRQNELNFGTPLSTAEVASTFMEDFVLQELLKQANDEDRLAIMMMKLNDDISSIFRQIACYTFEQQLHQQIRQQGYLSAEQIGELFQERMVAYMGDAVEQSAGSQNWWVYWSHIRTFFYVYSYASGLLISKSLQASVKQDTVFIQQVKEFLSAGLSDSPKNIFAKLGIDISQPTFWQRGLNEVAHLLDETEALARKLGKIT